NDGTVNGTTVDDSATVQNSAPVATVLLDNTTPTTNQTITATATRSDVDGDAVSLRYVWKNGLTTVRDVTKSAGTAADLTDSLNLATAGNGDKGNTITVYVTPNDGTVNGTTVDASATVQNSAPVATDQTVTTNEDTAKTITLSGSDVDGDALT